jgi:hypothetical protein
LANQFVLVLDPLALDGWRCRWSAWGTGPPRGKYGKFRTPDSSGFPGLMSVVQLAAVLLPKHVTMQGVVHTSTDRTTLLL